MGGPHRGCNGTKSRSASPSTVRNPHLWGARNPQVLRSSTSNLDPVRQWMIARQVWAKPSVRGFNGGWVVLPWRLGAVHEFTKAARRNSGSGHEKAADAGLGLVLWGSDKSACDPHALGGDQCGEQRGPDVKHSTATTTIIQSWEGSVSTGEEPPHHSVELKHALSQAGGPTQSQLSRPMSSGHHTSMEHRLRKL